MDSETSNAERRPGLGGWLDDLRIAGAFLTILPISAPGAGRPGALAGAAWSFPVIGLLVGLAAGIVHVLAGGLGLPAWLTATLAVATLVLLTGALHEDGLGDFFDGLGGGDRERRLQIMRDSQAGNFAVVALVLVLAARIAALAAIADPDMVGLVLAMAATASRAAMVAAMHLLPNARGDGLSVAAGRPDRQTLWYALAIAAAVAVLAVGPAAALTCLAMAAIGGLAIGWLAQRRLGGQTGDVLGAVQQCAELGCLLAAAAAL